MKKLFTLIALVTLIGANAQTKLGQYAAVSYSVGNGAYNKSGVTSYATVEYGVTRGAWSGGIALGASEITKSANLYIEPKMSATLVEYKNVRGFFMSGAGVILNDQKTFLIEYGAGILAPVCSKADFCLQYSNWAGLNYVSVGFCVNL